MPRSASFYLALALFSLFGSCGSFSGSSREELARVVKEFNEGLRWVRMTDVAAHIAPEDRARYQERLGALGEEVEIIDYEMIGLEYTRDPKGDRGKARVMMQWIDRQSGTLQRTAVVQHWEDKNRQWVVRKQERSRGASMILFDEPPEAKPETKPDAATAAKPETKSE